MIKVTYLHPANLGSNTSGIHMSIESLHGCSSKDIHIKLFSCTSKVLPL